MLSVLFSCVVQSLLLILQKAAPLGRTLPTLFLRASMEYLACESKPHQEVIHRDAEGHGRKKGEGLADNLLENSHETRLQTHVDKMAEGLVWNVT